MSLCAYVPPYFPRFEYMPIAFVFSHYWLTLSVKVWSPAWFLNPSNSTELKFGLYIDSNVPKNSKVILFLNQFLITSSEVDFPSLNFVKSEIQI